MFSGNLNEVSLNKRNFSFITLAQHIHSIIWSTTCRLEALFLWPNDRIRQYQEKISSVPILGAKRHIQIVDPFCLSVRFTVSLLSTYCFVLQKIRNGSATNNGRKETVTAVCQNILTNVCIGCTYAQLHINVLLYIRHVEWHMKLQLNTF